MANPIVTDLEGTVSSGTFSNPIFSIPARVGDTADCTIVPPEGYEWVAGSFTIPAIPHIQMSSNGGADWLPVNTSLTVNELISYPTGKVISFKIESEANPAPFLNIPIGGLTEAGNAAFGQAAFDADIYGAATVIQIVSGAAVFGARVTGAASVQGLTLATGVSAFNSGTIGAVTVDPYPVAGSDALGSIITGAATAYNLLTAPSLSSMTAGDGSFTVTVGTVSGATNYDLRHKTSAGSTWTEVHNVGSGTETVTGLTNGTAYDVQARTVNEAGDGAWSATTTVTPAAAGPTAIWSEDWSSISDWTQKLAQSMSASVSGGNLSVVSTAATDETSGLLEYQVTASPISLANGELRLVLDAVPAANSSIKVLYGLCDGATTNSKFIAIYNDGSAYRLAGGNAANRTNGYVSIVSGDSNSYIKPTSSTSFGSTNGIWSLHLRQNGADVQAKVERGATLVQDWTTVLSSVTLTSLYPFLSYSVDDDVTESITGDFKIYQV